MKKLYTLFILLSAAFTAQAQMTGSFSDPIQFNATTHNVEYYVPTTYNSANSYPLLVALHGCNGNAVAYRNSFTSIADSIGAILVCPDFMGGQISGSDGMIIPNVIDSTINQLGYNINTNEVYLTGFSCNGQETMKQGWDNIYPFRALIPLNAWVPNMSGYNFKSTIPTCICSGTADGSYSNNSAIYDSLIANGGVGKFNSMPGIPHTSSFATRDAELMECFRWIDSVSAPNAIAHINDLNASFKAYPNPAKEQLNLLLQGEEFIELDAKLYNLFGQLLKATSISTKQGATISTDDMAVGTYIILLFNDEDVVGQHKVSILR